ncbi:TPA: four helix bundle protein [Candidatus Uhrbacteria bacterium]|uniref:Four helix bundle protein n=2 Tax=Candidatus Uhriibacteriota TaxID=1752732 RepID=A0A0G1Q9Z2_9BACT|nr:MAG: hypothetical protein UX45_C0002G0029 [Candidatus Uhrbacteria bacterium GW2011_GWF2_46_218]KKU41804.1 MAG: hypothetical protein UX57_C0001G0028 [Candidatus Uhrbacteria bacterium GW2011_GWE2_46_68]HBK34146.1 four helix bundle protein [Candidatus Uhrbacteria bacterium]HCB18782.1 four helix bundle protein [Candidatus Uhrbacteria bacterium]
MYDIKSRTNEFGKNIIEFVKKVPQNIISKPLISQLVKSGTSVGANYCEADNASSRKDFIHKFFIAKKEAEETKYWLKMVSVAQPEQNESIQKLWQEVKEIHLILHAIIQKTKNNPNYSIQTFS